MSEKISNNLACNLFQLSEQEADPTTDLFHRKHQAAMSRAQEILNYKPTKTSDVEETLNAWAIHMTRAGKRK